MSENIESLKRLQNKEKKHGTFTHHPKSSGPRFERKDSGVTKCSHFAVLRERIQLPNDNRHVLAFKKCYDRLFRDFKEKLLQEYVQMRSQYMQEYDGNYNENQNEK